MQPAASAGLPFQWDVAVIGANAFWNNNIFAYSPYRYNAKDHIGHSDVKVITGGGPRWAAANTDIHILNFLVALKDRSTAGAGWNIRGYMTGDQMDFFYGDTLHNITDFLKANALDKMMQGRAVNQNWMEWYATYARVLKDDGIQTWKAGATLKLIKGISAEFARVTAVQIAPLNDGTGKYYFSRSSAAYGYSANLDKLDSGNTDRQNLRYLRNGSPVSLGLDLGISLTRKNEVVIAGFPPGGPGDYNWKLTVSLTDIGRLKYPYGAAGRQVLGPRGQVALTSRFQRMVDTIRNLTAFDDSLAKIADLSPQSGGFTVSLPTAFRVNFDKSLAHHLYVNASLVLDASFLDFSTDEKTRQLSYLILTPRWETAQLAAYLPFYVNAHGSAMLGAALRVGPLVAGVDDFRWLLGHESRTGGAYLGIVIRRFGPGKGDCPLPGR